MREFLDSILEFIDAETLTDDEFGDLESLVVDEEYNVTTYSALKGILEERESVSTMLYRLAFFFLAKGIQVATVNTSEPLDAEASPRSPASQIMIGVTL